MRVTPLLFHGKYFWWGKGWGQKPAKDISIKNYKLIWRNDGKRPITEFDAILPTGVTAVDAVEFVNECLEKERYYKKIPENLIFPFPYNTPPIKGTPSDPEYRERSALYFSRYNRMWDPINQILVFSNSICESNDKLPPNLQLLSDIEIDDELLDVTERRLNWAVNNDGIMRKLPKQRLFPLMDQNPRRYWGIPKNRRELNMLNTFYDITETYIGKHYGYANKFKVSYPYCVVPFERDSKLVVLDLECDFIATTERHHSLPLFSSAPLLTIEKPLVSIHPLSWETCLKDTNFYPDDWTFEISPSFSNINCIYLSQNGLLNLKNEELAARAMMYCYGYAIAQSRRLYGEDINGKELTDPISIQCFYSNPSNNTFGFVCFQLNTASFDSPLKNQFWIDGPFHYNDDKKLILQKLIAFQSNGIIDNVTLKLKNFVSNS